VSSGRWCVGEHYCGDYRDTFTSSDETHVLVRFGFYRDTLGRYGQEFGKAGFDFAFVVGEFGRLGENGYVAVDDGEPLFFRDRHGLGEECTAVGVAILLVGIREEFPDIVVSGGTEYRVGDGVEYGVGVTVSDEPAVVGDFDPSEFQYAIGVKSVRIVSKSYCLHSNSLAVCPCWDKGETAWLFWAVRCRAKVAENVCVR
jgi:hypothetical protein